MNRSWEKGEFLKKCKEFKDIEDKLDEAMQFCNKYREHDKNLIGMFFWKCVDLFEIEAN